MSECPHEYETTMLGPIADPWCRLCGEQPPDWTYEQRRRGAWETRVIGEIDPAREAHVRALDQAVVMLVTLHGITIREAVQRGWWCQAGPTSAIVFDETSLPLVAVMGEGVTWDDRVAVARDAYLDDGDTDRAHAILEDP